MRVAAAPVQSIASIEGASGPRVKLGFASESGPGGISRQRSGRARSSVPGSALGEVRRQAEEKVEAGGPGSAVQRKHQNPEGPPQVQGEGNEREGYVPNVVYSCGSLLQGRRLIIPYAISDYATTFATLPLDELLAAME